MTDRDDLAELIAKAIEDTYHGFASACGDEVTISVTMQGEDSVSVDCDKGGRRDPGGRVARAETARP